MNLKYILVFSICSVPAFGSYEEESMPWEEKIKYDEMVKTWQKMHITDTPIKTDTEGNVILKILAKPGAKKNEIFVSKVNRIGVKIAAPPLQGRANAEMIDYLADVLEVRKSALSIISGLKSKLKNVKLIGGLRSEAEILMKLCLKLSGKEKMKLATSDTLPK